MSLALRLLLLAAVVPGLLACTGDGSADPIEYPPVDDEPDEFGPFGVGHVSGTVADAARADRSLLLDIWYPVDPGEGLDAPLTSYPLAAGIGLTSAVAREGAPVSARSGQTLLVFSHGYNGINTQSVELMEVLASHGFIIVSPEHTGNAQASPTDDFDTAAANRVPDVSFVIDTLFARGRDPADLFHGRLDEAAVGVVGHSFGGMTAVGVAAGWAGAEPDSRVTAIAPISAVIDGDLQEDTRDTPNAGFTAEQLADVEVPVLLVGGTADTNVPVENNAIAFERLTAAPWVYQVDISGANHTHFANVCAIGDMLIEAGLGPELWPSLGAEELIAPYEATCTEDAFPVAEVNRLLSLYVVSFFRRHLRGEEGYGAFLTAASAEDEDAIEFAVRHQD